MPRPDLRLLALGLFLTLPVRAEEVTVFAAASLKTALDAVAADFQAETGHQVTISYAGSNQLAQQILQGAPADVFVSAAENWMDEVEKAGLVTNRRDLLGNDLVLIATGAEAPALDPANLASALGDEKLAMALVDAVPAGQYGKAALESLGVWQEVEPKVAQTDNVRAALALVSTGEAPFGIVYASDAKADPSVSIVASFPADSHPPIVYPAALLQSAGDRADEAFFRALSSDKADATFQTMGFRILN